MKYIINHKIFTLFLTFIWCILCGSFSIHAIIIGLVISSIAIFLGCHIPGGAQYLHSLNVSFFNFLKFMFILFIDIYISTFKMFKLIFTSNINPRLVPIKTSLNNDWSIFFLANAITLTPGTVTVNRKGNKLLILTTYPEESNKIVNQSLVNALSKGVKH
ncbi:hypothetical protein SH1V18_46550 [Vallitalea longa]|uniref:Uncharacterized protein n=1 Tax=Vallitalea longa TaxID=2936439 RepID=A0A9W6DH06_9FIRM|nr:Na+/H+ antiporter subunit E [Vallitalea longa]GKX32175.1 hypothetical protein SH1V18_46550 [Vallitalea longa]